MKRFLLICALLVTMVCSVELLNKADALAADFHDDDLFYVYDPAVARYYYPTVSTFLAWLQDQGDILSESDPYFSDSPASDITQGNLDNWNAAFLWGDHSGLYEEALGTPASDGLCVRSLMDGTRFWGTCGDGGGGVGAEVDPIFAISPAASVTLQQIMNWNTSFSWGNHSGLYSLTNHQHDGTYQPFNEHLVDLSSGTLTGSKVGVGISGTNITTGTVADARIASTIARLTDLPVSVSQLENDLNFITIDNMGDLSGVLTTADIGTGIGDVVALVDDGSGAPALPFSVSYNDLVDTPTVNDITSLFGGFGEYLRADGTLGDPVGSGGASSLSELSDWPPQVSSLEVSYLDNTTSNIQAQLNLVNSKLPYRTPPTYSDSPCTAGQYAADVDYFYICVATNSWSRLALADWSNGHPPEAILTVTPSSYNYGVVTTPEAQDFVITNTGDENLVMQSPAFVLTGGAEFSVTANTCTGATIVPYTDGVASNESCTLTVTYTVQ